MKTSLIIPTYRRQEILIETLKMVLRQQCEDLEVLVVDQSPTRSGALDGFLLSCQERVRYYTLSTPNLPAARNFGILRSSGEVIIFIDDDVELTTDYVSRHLAHYASSNVGAVAGLTMLRGREEPFSSLRGARSQFRLNRDVQDGEVVGVAFVNGGNTSFRREALLDAGLFDETYSGCGWYEDYDLSLRVNQKGYRLLLDTAIRLVHLALPSGGCENRNELMSDVRRREQLVFRLYTLLKNRRYRPLRSAVHELYRAYREHSMSGVVLRSGLPYVVRRHIEFCAASVCVIQFLSGSRASLI